MTTTKTHLCHYDQPLYHVGDMNGKPWPTSSMEGPLLSCSSYPEDWRAIARLGQAPIWTVQRIDGTPIACKFPASEPSRQKALAGQGPWTRPIHPATLYKAQVAMTISTHFV